MGIEIQRIRKGFQYFLDLKPSQFVPGQKLLLTEYLMLLKPLIELYEKWDSKKTVAPISDDKLYNEALKIFGPK